ncbi:MAG: PRC-barrel domain-containing protein [Pseudomonadota bacterium]
MKFRSSILAAAIITAGAAAADTSSVKSTDYNADKSLEDSAMTAFMGGLFDNVAASDLIGARIYTIDAEMSDFEWFSLDDGWKDIGEIDDITLSADGSVEGVNIDIGGFLGVNETSFTVEMSALQLWTEEPGADNDSFFVVMSQDKLAEVTDGS